MNTSETKEIVNYDHQVLAHLAVDGFRHFHPFQDEVKVCELGADEGLRLLYMRELVGASGKYLGIEPSAEVVARKPRLPSDTQVIQGDLESLSDEVEEGYWDMVTCTAVLENLAEPHRCIEEAMRILRPGGVLVATCSDPFWGGLAERFGDQNQRTTRLDSDTLVILCQDAGFVSVSFRPFTWALTGLLPHLGLELQPEFALQIDHFIHQLHLVDFSFVNYAVIAQKPY